jgi:hypothetical protein
MKFVHCFSYFLCFFYVLNTFGSFGQGKITISGFIKDASTSEDLIGASIFEPTLNIGTSTNAYGYFALQIPIQNDSITLRVAYAGYTNLSKRFAGNQNSTFNFQLKTDAELQVVEITADKFKDAINETQMSVTSLSAKEIKTVPVIFGESDLIKVLQLKPGIKGGNEGSAGLYVRGGGPDQNLILLDEATVYNASHLFGFFSVFNSDAIKNVDLYKGDFPAQYGGRLSSVLDIKMKDGNKQKFSGSGGIGLISSRLTLEVPIQKEKSSFIISGRRTYFDIFTKIINRRNEGKKDYQPIPNYYFYDLNLKANYELSNKDRLFLSGYFGRDVFGFSDKRFKFNFDWGNTTATVRWNHVFNPTLFMNVSAIFSDYQYNISNEFTGFNFATTSKIKDYNFKVDFDYSLSPKHQLKFGGQFIQHLFIIGRVKLQSSDKRVDFQAGNELEGSEMGVYVADDYTLNDRLRFNFGVRATGFASKSKFYGGLEPRFAIRYKADEETSVKVSFSQMYQYLHLLNNSGASLPTDIWYPTTDVVPPQVSRQVALGVNKILGNGDYLLSNEFYYKWMNNQIDFKDFAQTFANDNIDKELVFGKGWSYGVELYLEKKTGRLTGWIGYTLSWTQRQFKDSSNGNPAINNGKYFYPRYDRRHDASLVVIYKISDRWTFSGAWTYGTGNAASLQTGRFGVQNTNGSNFLLGNEFTERNGFRMPASHRLDLNFIRKFKPRWGESDLTISFYNAYNRRNPYILYYDQQGDGDATFNTQYKAKILALFPIIPTVTYNFKF